MPHASCRRMPAGCVLHASCLMPPHACRVRAKRILGLKNLNIYGVGIYVDSTAARKALLPRYRNSTGEQLSANPAFFQGVCVCVGGVLLPQGGVCRGVGYREGYRAAGCYGTGRGTGQLVARVQGRVQGSWLLGYREGYRAAGC